MIQQRIGLLVVLASLLLAHTSAAHTVTGPDVSTDRSGAGLISFDLDINSFGTTIATVFTAGASGDTTFNAGFLNSTPGTWGSVTIELTDGATFSALGDVTDGSSTFFSDISGTATTATIIFAPDQAATIGGVEIGDPLGLTSALNWTINRDAIPDLDFDIIVTVVPEPGTALLMGLGLAALAMRRRA